ncbi:uncharacterized protein L969DRAFT_95738 [Mixia osmundae IAM 14324]|uniref:holo-[acyl-carrier-protein] synthase n=1 Tax=Mixia osmundae (strain CBS 9802 / IAM 14324 / JCM 22182 / KY 12970) TaxID=764103 RepID=G7E0P9_MIXOS|nr:uncharacterized protein L969DRAFT_95738 [Mixia osmundae IAM 14324]KEI37885.1 hypothetical protein L969DRAFT_95738 [Mixia osmundae IAM 14324]GAA96409.1 hypothetical protein E5Q_03076 [Mixia osmundae IAM 14324]
MRIYAIQISSWSPSNDLYNTLLNLLDAPSQSRIRQFVHRSDALRCLIGRLLPRYIISQETRCAFGDVQIEYSALGRPYCVSSQVPIDFNVSHDHDWVVMACATAYALIAGWPDRGIVGIDIMQNILPFGSHTSELVDTLAPQLSSDEQNRLRSSASVEAALSIWTLKEAYAKLTGQGLRMDMRRCSFDTPSPGGRCTMHSSDEHEELEFSSRSGLIQGYTLSVAWHRSAGPLSQAIDQAWHAADFVRLLVKT